MAEQRRKHDRVVFQKGFDVNIMAIDGTWRRTCTLKDCLGIPRAVSRSPSPRGETGASSRRRGYS